MIPLYTPGQVRAMDERTIAAGTPSATLMDRAAGHLARAVTAAGGRTYGLRVAVVCGKGNNAGDGIGAARRLRERGADARLHLVGGEDGLSPDAVDQLVGYRRAGGQLLEGLDLGEAEVVVDCLLGTGSSGEPRPPLDEAVDAINARKADRPQVQVVACDLPTGVDAETGAVAQRAVRADVTLTIGAQKLGLWLWPARGHCGRIECVDIGIAAQEPAATASVLQDTDVAGLLEPADPGVDKRGRGVVVVLAGSPGMSGAATMVARGALGMGVGLLTVATDAGVRDVVAAAVPEALTLGLPSDDEGAFAALVERLDGADVLAIGPGLGHNPPTVALVRRLVREAGVPVVLDADGLNAFRGDGDELAERPGGAELVCTPHARELARLLGEDVDAVWPRRVEAVTKAAQRWRATIVAKGPGSIIVSPDGHLWVNATGTAALATGGTGDVLTGMVAAAVTGGARPAVVAAAVHVHGRAGEIAAERLTPRSVAALDVADAIPAALAGMEP